MSPTPDDLARADMTTVPADLLAILSCVIDAGSCSANELHELLCGFGLATLTTYDPEKHGIDGLAEPGAPWISYGEPLQAALLSGRRRRAAFRARHLS